MKIHSLNCGSICPACASSLVGDARGMVCHCLLIETPSQGLVLVDSGFGLADVRNPTPRLGRAIQLMGARLAEEETALRQVERLGFRAQDVRHVVLTHMDVDHMGGISDFPHARIHVLDAEVEAAFNRPAFGLQRERYRPMHWAHGPLWAKYPSPAGESPAEGRTPPGERWMGFEAVGSLVGLPPEILLVPTPGHSRGHAAVAVRERGGRWWLHCGDAYFNRGTLLPKPRVPRGLQLFERLVSWHEPLRLANQARLRELAQRPGADVRILCAHDPEEFAQAASGTPAPEPRS